MINPYRVALALALTIPNIFARQVQIPGLILPPDAAFHRTAVVGIFNESYANYTKYAWGHDNLAPLSKKAIDDRNGWGATIVDSMSTMYIMGLTDKFEEAVKFVGTIDFSKSKTKETVSVFETTIRYVGGLLSAYELDGKRQSVLLQKAQEVADKLTFAWVDGGDIPYRQIDFATNKPIKELSNVAEAGSLILEWQKLSDFTGNQSYVNLALKAFRRIAKNPAPLPGLPAQGLDPATGKPVGGYVTWGGGTDSCIEYLIKYPRLTNPADEIFANTWYTAVNSSIQHLLSRSTVGGHVYLADYDDKKRIRHVSSHLACFHAGNWILGGRLLNIETIVEHGLELNEACWNTYASTATGIGPEVFAWISADGDFTGLAPPDKKQKEFYNEHGFYINGTYYVQRPEVLESNFYAWRATGHQKYFDRAVSAIDSFIKYLSTANGYSGIEDVNDQNTENLDSSESFWYAEVLKYLYLTFDDPSHISLDDYVFSTECHPFKAPIAVPQYGTETILSVPELQISLGSATDQPLPAVSPIPNLRSAPVVPANIL